MDVERYMILRTRLCELYKEITEFTFPTFIPRSHFMSLKTLQRLVDNPTIHGTDWIDRNEERPLSVVQMCQALQNMNGEGEIYFSRPEKNIPRIYNAVQEYVGNWVDLMINYSWIQRPPLEELDRLEMLAKYLFPSYKEYKLRDILEASGKYSVGGMSLMDMFKTRMVMGADADGVSFISNMAIYRESQGLGPLPGGFDTLGGASMGITSTSQLASSEDPFNAFRQMQTGIGSL